MCLSTAYEVNGNNENMILERVTNVDVDGKDITLTNLLGMSTVVKGELKSVDLNRNEIRIQKLA